MIASAVVGHGLQLEFLKFGKGEATDSFNVPKQMLIGLAYAVFISSALCYGKSSSTAEHNTMRPSLTVESLHLVQSLKASLLPVASQLQYAFPA